MNKTIIKLCGGGNMEKFSFGDKVKIFDNEEGLIVAKCQNKWWYKVLTKGESEQEYEVNPIHIDKIEKI